MKGFSKNILLIAVLVLINLAIFLFCRLHTDDGNFIWGKTTPEKKFLVSIACIDLMRIYYFIYANSINVGLLGIYFAYYYRKRMGLILLFCGVLIFFGGNKVFQEIIYEDYYTIFQNQKVSEDFKLEPVKRAGKGIGKYLMKDITNKYSPERKSAIIGVGEVGYDGATETINNILYDTNETPEIRGDAYIALLEINSEKSASYARIFIGSAHPIADQEVMKYIKKERGSTD